MASNLARRIANNPYMDEHNFHMLWNAMLGTHFPAYNNYGIGLQTFTLRSGSFSEFMVVKFVGEEEEHVAVVVKIFQPWEATVEGKRGLRSELRRFMAKFFEESALDTIYAIGAVGLEWAIWEMRREPTGAFTMRAKRDWAANVTDLFSRAALASVADEVDLLGDSVMPSEDDEDEEIVLQYTSKPLFADLHLLTLMQ